RAASRRSESLPPSGMTKAVALRRSGLTSTDVTVIVASRRSGSRMLPRSSSSASRWRISSPTRSCRWPGVRFSFSDARRRGMACSSIVKMDRAHPARSGSMARHACGAPLASKSRLDLFDVEALDHVADLEVVVVLEGHAAFEAVLDLADLFL